MCETDCQIEILICNTSEKKPTPK